MGGYQKLGHVEEAAGDLEAARAAHEQADLADAEHGERSNRPTTQAYLADVNERLGDRAGAWAAIELSDELSAPEDVLNYAVTHRVRARLALADGDHEAAERWARSAVHNAFLTDFVEVQAATKLELAHALSP